MRARPRAWRGPLAVAAAFIAGTATARIAWADREVGVPPGTSLDWVAEMPRRHPTELYRVPGTSATPLVTPAGSGQTMSRPVSHPRTMSEVGPTTAMGYARVTTVDITGEVRWTSERPPFDLVEGSKKTLTGASVATLGSEVQAAYPPRVGDDLFWLAAAVILRKQMHPGLVSSAECVHELLYIGEPSQVPLKAARDFTDPGLRAGPTPSATTKPLITEALAGISVPKEHPRTLVGQSPEESMLLRMAAEELASGYPAAFDGSFCANLLALEEEEAAPILIRYLDPQAHPLLRRNACALLAGFRDTLSEDALLQTLTGGESDLIVRERAIDALVRRRNAGCIPWLVDAATQKGSLRALALYALGEIGDPKGAKTIVKALDERKDPDVLWAAVPAVARCRFEDPLGRTGTSSRSDAIAALKRLLTFLETAPEETFVEPTDVRPDSPDPPRVRLQSLIEMTVIALAKLGDETARAKLVGLLGDENALPPVLNPPGRNPQRFPPIGFPFPRGQPPAASPGTFGTLHVPALVILVECLPAMGRFGEERLIKIALDVHCEASLRISALEGLAAMKELKPALIEKVCELPPPPDPRFGRFQMQPDAGDLPSVRARALVLLAEIEPDLARERALKLIESADTSGTELVAAVRLLGKKSMAGVPVAELGRLLRFQIAAAEKQRPQPLDPVRGDRTLVVRAPVIEEILRVLGNSRSDAALAILLEHASGKQNPARAVAVSAAGGFEKALPTLVPFLDDDEPWVRYAAYRAFTRRIREPEGFADWLYGDRASRFDAIRKWKLACVTPAQKEAERRAAEAVERGLASYQGREKDPDAWKASLRELRALGDPALFRLVELAADPTRQRTAFSVLKRVTDELVPDDLDAWKQYLENRVKKAK